jgi:hypothetical protein
MQDWDRKNTKWSWFFPKIHKSISKHFQ